MIELISSNWKVIASCADSYITDIFCSCKRVINEWTHTIVMYASIHMPTGCKQKNFQMCLLFVKNAGIGLFQAVAETIFGIFLWPAEHVRPKGRSHMRPCMDFHLVLHGEYL